MREFIKKFESASNANDYAIVDIPFTSTIGGGTLTNLTCNQENKKIVVDGEGNINITDAAPVVPNNEIWYTSTKKRTPNSTAVFGANYLPDESTFDEATGKGILKFDGNITSIGESAFSQRGLTSVAIPNSVTSIKNYAFGGCPFTTITIPDSVTSIGHSAFQYCALTSITIPGSVKNINIRTFANCTNLTSVIISNGVTSIGQEAFYYCPKLTSIEIPNSVTSIGQSAFSGGCYSLTSITIPNGVTNIGKRAFSACRGLTSLSIPNSITSIGEDVFALCSSLTSITIPDNITSIESGAFYGCSSLTSVYISNNVTSISSNAFWMSEDYEYTGSLKTITVGEKVFTYNGYSNYFTITLGNGTDVELGMWSTKSCFLPDTEITLSDGTKKQVKDITYNDKLKVWNFDEGHYDEGEIAWLTKVGLKNNHYYQLTFSNGTILKTTGVNSNHKVYCTDTNKFEGVAYIEVGSHVYTENGIVTITDKQYIEEEVEYYNLITKQHFNCFANGILTSDRYGNIYPISDNMIFIKNERPVRPYFEFETVGIKRYWYDTLRLCENTETIKETKRYIMKLESQMREIE